HPCGRRAAAARSVFRTWRKHIRTEARRLYYARQTGVHRNQACGRHPALKSATMEDVTLREARPPDFDAILALWELMEERHTSLPDRREYLEALHRFAPDLFLVAEARGKPIGTIVGGWDGWRGHMARLAVSPYLRRSGVARSLVNEAEKRLRKRGAK